MAKRKKPEAPAIKYEIEIEVRKLGAKGEALREKINAALAQALQQIPVEVLEAHETIVVRTNSKGKKPSDD